MARFPDSVGEAYSRFNSHHQVSDLHIVIDAALRDFMPKGRLTGDQPLAGELRLIDDLSFDSLAVAEVIFFFEDLFAVKIETQDIVALSTVADLRAFVERKLVDQTAAA